MLERSPVATWRAIPGYESTHEVSDHGEVRSLDREVVDTRGAVKPIRGRLLKPTLNQGRYEIDLARDGGKTRWRVHCLVLEAFVGPRPAGLVGCHNDGNPLNNTPSNLRWDTMKNNMYDKLLHGTDHNLNKDDCKFGHPLAEPNLVPCHNTIGAFGLMRRSCLACSRAHSLRSAARRDGRLLPDMQTTSDAYYAWIVDPSLEPPARCKWGHLLADPNVRPGRGAAKTCRSCRYAFSRRYYLRDLDGTEIDFQAVSDARYAELMANYVDPVPAQRVESPLLTAVPHNR